MNDLNMSSACNQTNPNSPRWNYVPILSSIITVAGLLTNGLVLLVIVVNHTVLITPFNIYLINLLVGNLLNLILFFPLNVVHLVYGDYWWLGNSTCTFYIYGMYLLNASLGHGHLLITLNRLWAVTFPLSYRSVHRQSLAIKLCLAKWAYLHVVVLPGLFLDALYHRQPVEKFGCSFNVTDEGQFNWGVVVQIVMYDLPIVLIAICYIITAYATIKRYRKKAYSFF